MRTKKTLRKLPPLTRAIAKNMNAIELALNRIEKVMAHLERTEHDAEALINATQSVVCPACGHTEPEYSDYASMEKREESVK